MFLLLLYASLTGVARCRFSIFYLFRTRADDACRIFIDEQLVVSDKNIRKGEGTGAIALKKGYHSFRIEFVEKEGDARLRIYTKCQGEEDWKSNDFKPYFH